MTTTIQTQTLFVKMALMGWDSQVKRATALFNTTLSEEQLLKEIAPGRNRGVYLMGHLLAVSDALFTLFGLGERLHPELDEAFLSKADRSGLPIPAINELRQYWDEVHTKLSIHFNNLSTEEWFQRHTAVSEEDFAKEPHRNKLNVLLGRTSHMAYHIGQVILLK